MKHQFRKIVLLSLLLGTAGVANASLITNGTFDTDLSGWTVGGSPGAVWNSEDGGEAWLGVPGPNGTSTIGQDFTTLDGFGTVVLSFDWDFVGPGELPPPDEFMAVLSYTDIYEGAQTVTLFSITDENAPISGSFLKKVKHVDWTKQLNVTFSLFEGDNQNPGTRIELDNVSAEAVPAPATLALFGLGLAGLGWTRRKKA